MSLKVALRIAAIACGMAVSIAAFAQSWPAKPIRLILGYPTGGATDAMARPLIAKGQVAVARAEGACLFDIDASRPSTGSPASSLRYPSMWSNDRFSSISTTM